MKTFLHLENGMRISGESFGWEGESQGEVVFSTGMTGYVQSLTDPSFAGQILTFTYPLIGNYGVPSPKELDTLLMENLESARIWVHGVIVGEACISPSHFQYEQTISDWLTEHRVPGIYGVDTRALTHIIRDEGCMRGILSPKESVRKELFVQDATHWVAETSVEKAITYKAKKSHAKHVVLIDCGVKHGIVRELLTNGVTVTRIPWDADPLEVKNIDGVVCSNGPGDPKENAATVAHVRKVVDAGVPFLGICLGHQILSLALGADTYKLPYGHRGLNQPCQDLSTKKAYVTSQNHGYAVDRKSIPAGYEEWFINLNDQTNEGIRHKSKNIQSVQFHPEGQPGPDDTAWIFRKFVDSL